MFSADRIYGLDIETDNSEGNGLNSQLAGITEIAVTVGDGGEVFAEGDEIDILIAADQYIKQLPSGLLSTWNGAVFDMPFIADRIKKVAYFISNIGPILTADDGVRPKYDPLPGHAGGYHALWASREAFHQHLDVAYAYKAYAESFGVHPEDHPQAGKPVVPWSLKPVCKQRGIAMVEIDRTRLHDYTPEEREAYVLSDGHGTRELAIQLLGA